MEYVTCLAHIRELVDGCVEGLVVVRDGQSHCVAQMCKHITVCAEASMLQSCFQLAACRLRRRQAAPLFGCFAIDCVKPAGKRHTTH